MSEPTPPPRRADDAVTWSVRVAAAWTWRLLVIAAGLYVLGQIFLRVELVAFSFILALFFTSVLSPLERALRRVPGPPSLSAALALLIGILALAGIVAFVSWQISAHSSELGDQINDTVDNIRDWLHNGPLHVKSSDLDKIAEKITAAVQAHQGELISGAIQTVQTVIEILGAVLLILLSTFFLLRDGELIWAWTLRLFPRPAQARLDASGRIGWRTLGGYMRGQLLIALFHGVSVMIVLFVLRVPLAAALGVLIFLGSFIPLVGLTVTGGFAVAVAGLEHGLTGALVVAIAIIVLIQMEAHFLQPVIMSRSVEVHPLAIALGVITGTILAGIVGALLAVPFIAFLNSTVSALRGAGPVEPPDPDAPPVDRSEREAVARGDAVVTDESGADAPAADEPEDGTSADV